MARRTAKYHIDLSFAYPRSNANFASSQIDHRARHNSTMREVEFMDSAMDGVDLHRRNDIETGLFKAKAHPASTGEKVDPDRPHFKLPSNLRR